MNPSATPLTELRINTYEDPFLQHQYVCLGHKIAIIRVSLNMSQQEFLRSTQSMYSAQKQLQDLYALSYEQTNIRFYLLPAKP